MKLLFDQNISHKILFHLDDRIISSSTIKNENLIDTTDKVIWEFAKNNNYTIVSQDSDFFNFFNDLGFPPKIIWIRTGNLRVKDLALIINKNYQNILSFINNDNLGCLEILKDSNN